MHKLSVFVYFVCLCLCVCLRVFVCVCLFTCVCAYARTWVPGRECRSDMYIGWLERFDVQTRMRLCVV